MLGFYYDYGAQGETRTHTPLQAGDLDFIPFIVFKRLFVEYCSLLSSEKLKSRVQIERTVHEQMSSTMSSTRRFFNDEPQSKVKVNYINDC